MKLERSKCSSRNQSRNDKNNGKLGGGHGGKYPIVKIQSKCSKQTKLQGADKSVISKGDIKQVGELPTTVALHMFQH